MLRFWMLKIKVNSIIAFDGICKTIIENRTNVKTSSQFLNFKSINTMDFSSLNE